MRLNGRFMLFYAFHCERVARGSWNTSGVFVNTPKTFSYYYYLIGNSPQSAVRDLDLLRQSSTFAAAVAVLVYDALYSGALCVYLYTFDACYVPDTVTRYLVHE